MVKLENIPWIQDLIRTRPVLIDELNADKRELLGPDSLQDELNSILQKPEVDSIEKQVKIVDEFRSRHLLRIVISEIMDDLPLMRVSDYLSFLAEAIISAVTERVWAEMLSKYGTPTCVLGDNLCDLGFIVVGYGKFGGLEMGYDSDLDLVFLHAGNWEDTQGTEISIDSTQFYIKMGQQVIKILGGQTITGALYETDLRLRPDGMKGILVQNINAYRDYLIERAQTWEHQALVRARAIIGDPAVVERFDGIRREVLAINRDKEKLKNEVKNMRERMLKELDKSGKDGFDLKQGKGGIIDIEFIVQYLTLLHAGKNYSLILWTDVVRLLGSMVENKILDEDTAYAIRNAYLVYRAYFHKLSLQKMPKIIKDEHFLEHRQKIIALYERLLQ